MAEVEDHRQLCILSKFYKIVLMGTYFFFDFFAFFTIDCITV